MSEEYEFETMPDPASKPQENEPHAKEIKEPHGYTPPPLESSINSTRRGKYILSAGSFLAFGLALYAGYKVYLYDQLLSENEIVARSSDSSLMENHSSNRSREPHSILEPTDRAQQQTFNSGFQDENPNSVIHTNSDIKESTKNNLNQFDRSYETTSYLGSKKKANFVETKYNNVQSIPSISPSTETTDDEWVISQLKSNAIEHGKKILQLEAQVALLQLDLTKQKTESFSAMQAASEAATTILAMREVLRKLNTKVRSLGGKISANEKNYASLIDKIEPKLGRLEKQVAKRTTEKKITTPTAPSTSTPREVQERKHMRSYSTVMVNDRAAFVLNLHSNERRVLEIGSKYPDLGRIEGVSRDSNSVFGVTNDGLSWVIKKSGS